MWKYKGTLWESNADTQSFHLKQLFDKECSTTLAAPLTMLVNAKRHKSEKDNQPCSHSDFPAEFKHCPYCNDQLIAPIQSSPSQWLPPYGSNSGIKTVSKTLQADSLTQTKGQPLILPSKNGRFSFFSLFLAAEKRLLISIQKDIGELSVYRPDNRKKWHVLNNRIGESDLPEWSWSIATDSSESGLALPSNQGPTWVTIDWATGGLEIVHGNGRSIAGIAKLEQFVLAPVMRGEHFFMLYRKHGDTQWSECATNSASESVAPQLCRNKEQLPFLAIPIVDDSRVAAYWSCRGGYIKVSLNAGNSPSWEFKPWETDEYPATALIELGPAYKKTGSRPGFWQLCEDYDPNRRGNIVNKIIKLDGDERSDSEEVEFGQFLSTGHVCFGWHYDHWKDVHERKRNANENTELRYPLLQFGETGLALIAKVLPWPNMEDMGRFTDVLFNKHEKSSSYVRFVIEGVGTPEKALYADGYERGPGSEGSLFPITVAELAELSVFIYDVYLYIYLPSDNTCFGWPIDLMDL